MSALRAGAQFPAQMSTRDGGWLLYVVLDTTDPWPGVRFERCEPPTFTERAAAFNRLGFELVQGAGWRWVEDSRDPDDPASPIVLIAATQVRSRPGEVA